jgi:NAD(P)-dependent dehydrogenase (short-subunit alcohol dehydrogenase family)
VLAARRADRLSAAVEAVEATGAEVIGVPTDVTKLADVERLADVAYERFGRVDVAFLNAGAPSMDRLLDPDLEQWRAAVDLNVFGLLHGIKAFIPRMVSGGGKGMVLVTTSGAGIHGTATMTPPYSVTKNAQLSIVECLYAQVRNEGADLHVGVVVPPLTRTNLVGDDLSVWEMVEAGLRSSGSKATLIEPEEFAPVVAEGIEHEHFWIEVDLEQDERLLGGRAAPMIEQMRRTVQAKATAMIEHRPPDGYLW